MYPIHKGIKSGRSAVCKACKVEKNKIYKYGFLTKQNSETIKNCQLCGRDFSNTQLCIDHDHNTGYVRGIICKACNSGLGLLGDSIEGIQKALDYLKNPPMESAKQLYKK